MIQRRMKDGRNGEAVRMKHGDRKPGGKALGKKEERKPERKTESQGWGGGRKSELLRGECGRETGRVKG